MAQEEHDVDKHEQIADQNGDDLSLTLPFNLILNRTLCACVCVCVCVQCIQSCDIHTITYMHILIFKGMPCVSWVAVV